MKTTDRASCGLNLNLISSSKQPCTLWAQLEPICSVFLRWFKIPWNVRSTWNYFSFKNYYAHHKFSLTAQRPSFMRVTRDSNKTDKLVALSAPFNPSQSQCSVGSLDLKLHESEKSDPQHIRQGSYQLCYTCSYILLNQWHISTEQLPKFRLSCVQHKLKW